MCVKIDVCWQLMRFCDCVIGLVSSSVSTRTRCMQNFRIQVSCGRHFVRKFTWSWFVRILDNLGAVMFIGRFWTMVLLKVEWIAQILGLPAPAEPFNTQKWQVSWISWSVSYLGVLLRSRGAYTMTACCNIALRRQCLSLLVNAMKSLNSCFLN